MGRASVGTAHNITPPMLLYGWLSQPIQLQLIVFAKPSQKYQDNHEQANKTCQCEGNGFSTCLEGFCALVCTKPSKQVEKPFPPCWHILLACSWLYCYFCIMARMKQTPRKPKDGSVKAISPKNKGKWSTAAWMVQNQTPNLSTHPTLNRAFYGGMYCRHCICNT